MLSSPPINHQSSQPFMPLLADGLHNLVVVLYRPQCAYCQEIQFENSVLWQYTVHVYFLEEKVPTSEWYALHVQKSPVVEVRACIAAIKRHLSNGETEVLVTFVLSGIALLWKSIVSVDPSQIAVIQGPWGHGRPNPGICRHTHPEAYVSVRKLF